MSSKIVIIGDSGVGKSSIVKRYILNVNSPVPNYSLERTESTVGATYFTIQLERNKLQIWDTAGQERFRSICPIYFRGSAGCIFVFDVTNRESFINLNYWIKSYKDAVPKIDSKVLLLANKTDYPISQWQVNLDEISAKSHELDCEFMCTSAIKMTNFDEFCNYVKITYNDPPDYLPTHMEEDRSYCSSCL